MSAVAKNEVADLDAIETEMLDMPQVECPVKHIFLNGVYIREVTMPKGALVLGHAHKDRQLNTMIKGKMIILIDGMPQELNAPLTYIGEAGRKAAYILEETIFQNIYATDETDIDKLEEMFVDKSEAWQCSKIAEVSQKLKVT